MLTPSKVMSPDIFFYRKVMSLEAEGRKQNGADSFSKRTNKRYEAAREAVDFASAKVAAPIGYGVWYCSLPTGLMSLFR